MRQNRETEALRRFQAALTAPGERWPLVAATPLCVRDFARQDFDEVDGLFRTAQTRFDPRLLALYVPAHLRADVVTKGTFDVRSFGRLEPAEVRRLQLTLQLADLFQESQSAVQVRYNLLRAYAL